MKVFIVSFLLFISGIVCGQESFLLLGDLHYDRIEDHDMEWLAEKPGDLRQVMEGYTRYTAENWVDFTQLIRKKVLTYKPTIQAVIQLGDLSEGLAGSIEKADQMAGAVIDAVSHVDMPVPWVIAKGNHDITGPGAPEAFKKHYIPFFADQLKNEDIVSANYSCRFGNSLFICLDPWDRKTDMVAFLENELEGSDAKYKFVLIHEPVIPVNERCWHVLRKEPVRRQALVDILGKHGVIVLSAHLHLYTVVKRETRYGPFVQIGINSVVKDRKHLLPRNLITEYGPVLAENKPEWQPETLQQRIQWLKEEEPYISCYKQMDLPGYGILTIDELTDDIRLAYYPAFGKEPYDVFSITELLRK